MHTKLALARELVSCLGGFELKLVSDEDDSVAALIRDTFYGSVFPSITDRTIEMYLAQLESGRVYFLGGILELSYIVIRLGTKQKYLIAGPCRLADFSESKVRASLHLYDLSSALTQQILSYCRWQPYLPPEKFHQLGILLGRHVLDLPDPIPFQHVEYHWNSSRPVITEPPPIPTIPESARSRCATKPAPP